ncbi:MAG: SAM-dependent chlorinase/fluorinase [Blastocatellia bacterium]|nr:SAM-dependent chlorinase/fluorinase [Blastocatellia bacterium]
MNSQNQITNPRSSIFNPQFITLLTDFGLRDYFVPAVKGVIYTINPQVQIADLTHEVAPHDIASAAFILAACYRDFPRNTIHLVVVDPGVGSERRAIVIEAGDYQFVGPDNGVFSYVYAREAGIRVFHVTSDEVIGGRNSRTFQGRDLFAPVAAWLSRGLSPGALGEEIEDYIKLEIQKPKVNGQKIEGSIIHIDRFGNCITNLTLGEFPLERVRQPGVKLEFAGREVTRFCTHFAEAAGSGELFAYPGSAGYWEIAIWCGSAAEVTGAQVGDHVIGTMEHR